MFLTIFVDISTREIGILNLDIPLESLSTQFSESERFISALTGTWLLLENLQYDEIFALF